MRPMPSSIHESASREAAPGAPAPPLRRLIIADQVEALPAPAVTARPSRLARAGRAVWLFSRQKPLGAFGGVLVFLMIFMAIFADWIAPYQYDETIRRA